MAYINEAKRNVLRLNKERIVFIPTFPLLPQKNFLCQHLFCINFVLVCLNPSCTTYYLSCVPIFLLFKSIIQSFQPEQKCIIFVLQKNFNPLIICSCAAHHVQPIMSEKEQKFLKKKKT